MLRRLFLALVLATVGLSAGAEDPQWVEGEHYDLITPAVRTNSGDDIEVAEFFWYGCNHCYNFEPVLEKWRESKPDDVAVVGSPAMWNPLMEIHARAFYTAKALGVFEEMHPVIFQAINVDRKRLASEDALADLFAAHGVDREDFSRAYNSFGVDSQVRQANARARSARITGTPEMMVNGKYRITTRKAGSQANMLRIADYLIEKERASMESAG